MSITGKGDAKKHTGQILDHNRHRPTKLNRKIAAGEFIGVEELLPKMYTWEDSEPGTK